MNTRIVSLLAILILVPAASIGTLAGLKWGPGTAWGQGVYFFCKVILLLIPALWLVGERRSRKNAGDGARRARGGADAPEKTVGRNKMTISNLIPGAITGAIIFVIIIATGLLLHRLEWIDVSPLRALAAKNHLTHPAIFVLFALGTTFINALLEEFVWRWFVTSRLQSILPATPQFPPLGALTAAAISAACFTIHHTIILSLYFTLPTIILGSLGVFAGALIWSLHFVRSRSILPGYLSHILADAAIFILAWFWIVA